MKYTNILQKKKQKNQQKKKTPKPKNKQTKNFAITVFSKRFIPSIWNFCHIKNSSSIAATV